MKRRDFLKVASLIAVAIALGACSKAPSLATQPKPNIIYILADDLGYGDLSCYGQTRFTTPNIDTLAKQGMRFTQHYAGNTVCAPSRCSLLTGLHTGHGQIRGNREIQPVGQHPIDADTFTVFKMLKTAGYKTGMFGKWGLGFPGSEGDPMNQGLDRFFGYNCQRNAHTYYPSFIFDNKKKIDLDGKTYLYNDCHPARINACAR
jgi:arylsulfatase A-like enzyme